LKNPDFLIAAAVAFALSLGLTPLMISLSKKLKILDMPGARKAHSKPMPLMGGVAMYIATILAALFFILVFVDGLDMTLVIAFMIGITGVTAMGLIDDIMRLSARRRLLILFILALIVLVGCLQFYFPPTLMQSGLGIVLLVSLVVVVWIVAITNAINFADGLDGLASGLSLISVLGFAVIFYLQGRTQLALPTAFALCGAIAGFLPYNLNKARVFMGDAGSMFIGFMLGIFTIMSMSEESVQEFIVPVYLILVPIVDMCMAVLRRLIMKKPVMKPDDMHFHHMLSRRLKSKPLAVLVLTLMQVASAVLGILIYRYKVYLFGWILIGCIAVAAIIYTIRKARILMQMERDAQAAPVRNE
jgi:UDP-GlcNAc:undecaprenyl-phosphate GlcNAc-1-phosphate transferase